MEAGPLGGQLDEHRDRAVRLRPRCGEEAVGDLALNHHAPELDARQAVEALDDERRRDVVGQVRDELVRRRLELGEVERERVAEVELDAPASRAQMRLERAVELDRVHQGDALGQVRGEHPEAGPDLQHDVVARRARRGGRSRRGCSRRPGSAGRAPSSARALTERRTPRPRSLDLRGKLVGSSRAARRAPRPCGRRSPARSASRAAAAGEVRAVGLGQEPVGRDSARAAERRS